MVVFETIASQTVYGVTCHYELVKITVLKNVKRMQAAGRLFNNVVFEGISVYP